MIKPFNTLFSKTDRNSMQVFDYITNSLRSVQMWGTSKNNFEQHFGNRFYEQGKTQPL